MAWATRIAERDSGSEVDMDVSRLRALAVLVFIIAFANLSYAKQADEDAKGKGADEECDYSPVRESLIM